MIEIEREYRSARTIPRIRDAAFVEMLEKERTRETLAGGLVRQSFPMVPALAGSLATTPSNGWVDPFAAPTKDLRNAFVAAGIAFSDGASVRYDEGNWMLIVVNTGEQMDLVEAYLESLTYCPGSSVHVSAEIYELPRLHATQIVRSAIHESEHTPERDAVFRALERGKARLVSMPSVRGNSGQRSTVETTIGMALQSPQSQVPQSEKSEGKADRKPELRDAETRLEVDPVVGADGSTVDLKFRLAHAIPSGKAGDEADSRFVRQAKIDSVVTLTDGSYLFVGSWDAGEESARVVFMTATVVPLGEARPMIKMDDSEESK